MKLRITVLFAVIILLIFGIHNNCFSQVKSDSAIVAKLSAESDAKDFGYINPDIYEMPSFSGMLVKGIFSLLAVFALILAFVLFLKRFVYNRGGSNLTNGLIKIINTTFIAPKKSIYLIKIVDKILVVGVTENQMQTLAEFSEEEIPQYINETRKTGASAKQFSSYINLLLDKMKKRDLQEDKS